MYTLRIVNHVTQEILEGKFTTASAAKRAANIAYFAAQYDDNVEILVISNKTGEIIWF